MNSKTPWTPGPWIIADCPIDMETQADILKEDIGTEKEWVAVGLVDEEGFAAVTALCHPGNARLIAAAPELVDALRQAVSACDEICQSNLPPLVIASFAARFNGEKARNLLAKLEGGKA